MPSDKEEQEEPQILIVNVEENQTNLIEKDLSQIDETYLEHIDSQAPTPQNKCNTKIVIPEINDSMQ